MSRLCVFLLCCRRASGGGGRGGSRDSSQWCTPFVEGDANGQEGENKADEDREPPNDGEGGGGVGPTRGVLEGGVGVDALRLLACEEYV